MTSILFPSSFFGLVFQVCLSIFFNNVDFVVRFGVKKVGIVIECDRSTSIQKKKKILFKSKNVFYKIKLSPKLSDKICNRFKFDAFKIFYRLCLNINGYLETKMIKKAMEYFCGIKIYFAKFW